MLAVAIDYLGKFVEARCRVEPSADITGGCRVSLRVHVQQSRGPGAVRVVAEHYREICRLVKARCPKSRHRRAECVIAVTGHQDDVIVGSRELDAKRGATAPSARAAPTAEVRANLAAFRIPLDVAAVTQSVIENDRVLVQQPGQFIS